MRFRNDDCREQLPKGLKDEFEGHFLHVVKGERKASKEASAQTKNYDVSVYKVYRIVCRMRK